MPVPLPRDPGPSDDPDYDPFAPIPWDQEPIVPVSDPADGQGTPVRLPGQPVRPPAGMQ